MAHEALRRKVVIIVGKSWLLQEREKVWGPQILSGFFGDKVGVFLVHFKEFAASSPKMKWLTWQCSTGNK